MEKLVCSIFIILKTHDLKKQKYQRRAKTHQKM